MSKIYKLRETPNGKFKSNGRDLAVREDFHRKCQKLKEIWKLGKISNGNLKKELERIWE